MADYKKIKLVAKVMTFIACGLQIGAGIGRFFIHLLDPQDIIVSIYLM